MNFEWSYSGDYIDLIVNGELRGYFNFYYTPSRRKAKYEFRKLPIDGWGVTQMTILDESLTLEEAKTIAETIVLLEG